MNFIRDLEAVRNALGYEQVNLYGGSYGTRVGLVYLREFPKSIRSAVLDAVAPLSMRVGMEMGLDAQASLDKLMQRCESDTACNQTFPNLSLRFKSLLSDLSGNPKMVKMTDPATGVVESVELTREMLVLGLRGLLYSPITQRLVPLLINQGMAGDWQPLLGVAASVSQGLAEVVSSGLMLAVLCTEDLAELEISDISATERASFVSGEQAEELLEYCAIWPKPQTAANWASPVDVSIPVLLLSGAYDPVTPPYRAEAAMKNLNNARHLVVENGGHIVAGMGCMPSLVAEFYAGVQVDELDPSCLDEIPARSFFTNKLGPQALLEQSTRDSQND